MSKASTPSLVRQRYHDPRASAEQQEHADRLLRLLLVQDGSATRLCEELAGGPVYLHVWRQTILPEAPNDLKLLLPGKRILERISSLCANGRVMTDNLPYIALDGLEPGLQRLLHDGQVPIGHLLQRL